MSTLMIRMREQEEIEDPNNVKVVTDRKGFALLLFTRPSLLSGWRRGPGVYKHLGFYAIGALPESFGPFPAP